MSGGGQVAALWSTRRGAFEGAMESQGQAADRLLRRLNAAVKAFTLYPPPHPAADQALETFEGELRPYLDATGPFTVRVAKHALTVDGQVLDGVPFADLAFHLYTRKVAQVTILPAATRRDLAAFLGAVARDRMSLEASGGVADLLWAAEVGTVQVVEMALEQEEAAESLGLSVFYELIGAGRLAGPERERLLEIVRGGAGSAARLLQNVHALALEVFPESPPADQVDRVYRALRTLDRLALDEPFEEQPALYDALAHAPFHVEEPLGSALARTLLLRAGEDSSARLLVDQLAPAELADLIVRSGADVPEAVRLLTGLAPGPLRAEAVAAALAPRLGTPEGWLREALRPLLQPTIATAAELLAEFAFDESQAIVRQEEFEQRVREAQAISDESLTVDAVRTLVDVLRNEEDPAELAEVADALSAHLPWLAERRHLAVLEGLLRELNALAQTAGPAQAAAAQVLGRAAEGKTLETLLTALWATRGTPDEAGARACLQALGGTAVGPLVRVLGSEPRAGMRAMLCDLLVGVGRGRVAELTAHLSDGRWYLVRNLADVLGRIGDPSAVPALAGLLRHEEYRVRREAVDALARLGTAEAQRHLVALLRDPDGRIVLRALQALNAEGLRLALPELTALLDRPDPMHRLFELKRAALEALERLGGPEVVPILRRLVSGRVAWGRQRTLRDLARRALAVAEAAVAAGSGRSSG